MYDDVIAAAGIVTGIGRIQGYTPPHPLSALHARHAAPRVLVLGFWPPVLGVDFVAIGVS